MADPIDPAVIQELATAPKQTKTDEGEVEERYMSDVIKGDQYAATSAAQSAGIPWGLRIARTKPPSALGSNS